MKIALPIRTKLNELRTDDELEKDARNRAHKRRERLQDALNNVGVIIIYVIPGIIVVLGGILFYHYVQTNNWSAIETALKLFIGAAAGYIIRHFQEHGVDKE